MMEFKIKKSRNELSGIEISIEGKQKEKRNINIFFKLLMGGIIGFVNGFWGGGGGMICVPLLMQGLKLPEKNAHATTLLIMLPLSITSLIVYFIFGNLEILKAVKVGIGFIIGGLLGAVLLQKINNVWLGIIFSLIIISGGIKLLI